MRTLIIAMLLSTGCGGKVPPHLQVTTPGSPGSAEATRPDSAEAAFEQLLGRDPFLRRAQRGPAGWWDAAGDQSAALAAWQASPPFSASARHALEQDHAGTVAVPLARADRLLALEDVIRRTAAGLDGALAEAWGLERQPLVPRAPDSRPEMEWLRARGSLPEATFYAAERAVLLGWLDGPELPLGPVDAALEDGRHDRWIDSPAGALLRARARKQRNAGAAERGRELLAKATHLALAQVAADRDREQAAWAAEAKAVREALKLDEGADPISHLLREAHTALILDAGSDDSTGLALVALQAERLRDSCPDRPCGGLDRIWGLRRARAWGEEPARAADTWRLVVAKDTLDRFTVGHDRPGVGPLLDALAELASGELRRPVDIALVQRPAVDPALALAFTRAASAPEGTTADDVAAVLRALVAARAAALEGALGDDDVLVQRIRTRAAQP